MEQRRTDPRLLNLILAVMGFVNAENEPKNPLVRGFGNVQNDRQAYDYLVRAVNDCEEFFPEVEQFLSELVVPETE